MYFHFSLNCIAIFLIYKPIYSLHCTGEAEESVTDLNFPRLSIYRPGLLICERKESRMFEFAAQVSQISC